MVWVVSCDDIKYGSKFTTIWDDDVAACKDICAMIVNDINADWDLYDPYVNSIAQTIQNFINLSHYKEAIKTWNNSGHAGAIWIVKWEALFTSADISTLGKINFPNVTINASNSGTTSTSDQDPITAPPAAPSMPGATCRGPCKNYNEYAYADRADGSYICRQCNTFKSIFGS